jgi:DNA uptake protein ComE-like DNA-binding protein
MASLEGDERQGTSRPQPRGISGLPVLPAPLLDRVHLAGAWLRLAAVAGVLIVFSFWLGTRFSGGLPFADGPGVHLTTWEIPTPAALSVARASVARRANSPTPVPTGVPAGAVATASLPSEKVDLNTAGVEEMRRGLHVRRSTADRIVAYRQRHGRFTSLDDLLAVPLSRSTLMRIAPRVVFR